MVSSQTSDDRAIADGTSATRGSGYRWLAGVWVVVAVFAAVTVVRSHYIGIPIRDPDGAVFRNRVFGSLAMFAVLMLVDACVRTGFRRWTVRKAWGVLRQRWPPERLAIALSGLLAYYIVYASYHNLKSWDAFNTVRDDLLLRVDKWLFFGHSPAILLHDLFGQHIAAYIFAVIYESFSTMVTISVVAVLVFANRIRDSYVFLMSALWTWILGVCAYYLIPSIGPFHSAPSEFAQLTHTMITSTQARYMAQRAHLLAHPSASDAFAQVSAFASLHVGFTCMILFMLRYFGFRLAARVMTVYLFAVILATVYFGWHFFVDDIAGVILAYLAVLLGRIMIYPRGRLSTLRHSGGETGATLDEELLGRRNS